ncbi:adhesion G protein-coupled receptor A1 [Tenrec ecaudatus]|uniref:adhesion G protein-coupled receptor A1 n=1 Tax=Tenrec ecaudatus TaxID=94439 RepID=UPI003F5AC5BB
MVTAASLLPAARLGPWLLPAGGGRGGGRRGGRPEDRRGAGPCLPGAACNLLIAPARRAAAGPLMGPGAPAPRPRSSPTWVQPSSLARPVPLSLRRSAWGLSPQPLPVRDADLGSMEAGEEQAPGIGLSVPMDLKTVLPLPQHPGELLHPVVYACTAVMLLCLLASAVTYVLHRSAIRISRKGRHTLLNLCFHVALTVSAFAGGINRTKYPILCRAVGIMLHYATLSTLLWIGVTARNIYRQVTKKAPPCASADQPPFPRQPLLRFYLLSGGVPFIICGVTAATDIRNYGAEDGEAAYCWMSWEPSLGAFYGPAAFITLVSCVYFLGTYVQLRRHPECRYELRERTEEQQRLAAPDTGPGHRSGPGSEPCCEGAAASSLLRNEHSFRAQLRAAAFTLFLFTATWAFGALAVSQGPFLDMIFSCLYGAFCVTLGLFVVIHHCAKREDVWRCWWSCCPARRRAGANADCLPDSPRAGHPGCGHHPAGHCKMTNLQAAQSHAHCLSPTTPCCANMHCEQLLEEAALGLDGAEDAFGPGPPPHRCLPGRTRPPIFGRPRAAYHIPASLDGSPRSSPTDSPPSSLEGPAGAHTLACCAQGDPFPMAGQSEGNVLYGCTPRPGPAHFEMLRRTQSLPFGGPGQNGALKGSMLEGLPYGADSTGNIRTGPWRNETTV